MEMKSRAVKLFCAIAERRSGVLKTYDRSADTPGAVAIERHQLHTGKPDVDVGHVIAFIFP